MFSSALETGTERIRRGPRRINAEQRGIVSPKSTGASLGREVKSARCRKAMEPEKMNVSASDLTESSFSGGRAKVRCGLVPVQMHGNENSDAENYLKTFRASES